MPSEVHDAVVGLWSALSDRDWDGVAAHLAENCIYVDMPVGPTLAARGPQDIVARLQVGIAPLAAYRNHPGTIVSDDEIVMYEHSESWAWATGETAELPFVSVHRVRDGKVALWKDYWDFGGLANTAPPTWLEDLAQADTSWIFDATGLI
ncbi:nuclear transport factor 2 family protein [Williamsia sp. SKLECPSW1]